MNFVRIYIQTFNSALDYTGEFIEVTDDVDKSSLGNISQQIDNDEYDVGTFKYTDFKFTLRNNHGRYGDIGALQSIFTDKRTDSIVKVTWSNNHIGPVCGATICGNSYLTVEKNVFYGLLNDRGSKQNILDNKISFSVQGLESVFDTVETNFSSLTTASNISVNIYTLLNQTGITDLMTVDQANITCSIDQLPDSVAELEETTVKEALDKFLAGSNSILYVDIETLTVYVKPRTPTASVIYTFYGQASNEGSENIISLNSITSGLNNTFNSWKWKETTTVSKDSSSIVTYGVQKKEIENDLLTNTTKRQNVLDDYKDEFAFPKQQFKLGSILDHETVDLFFMDRVVVDYPTVLYPASIGDDLPLYGVSQYGIAQYPEAAWSITLDDTVNFKIMGRTMSLKTGSTSYELREI